MSTHVKFSPVEVPFESCLCGQMLSPGTFSPPKWPQGPVPNIYAEIPHT